MDFVIASLEMETEKCDRKQTEKDLLQHKVPLFGISSAAAIWQTTWDMQSIFHSCIHIYRYKYI